MRVIVNLFGTEIRVGAPLGKFLKEDLGPVEGCTILLNGRNIGSLGPGETKVRDGDEITFTVLVAGG